MGTIVSRLKGGGLWDPMIGRFSWWVLDGPPIMELLEEPVLDKSIPSIEHFCMVVSLVRNSIFKYDQEALAKVVEWGNSMRLKSMILPLC